MGIALGSRHASLSWSYHHPGLLGPLKGGSLVDPRWSLDTDRLVNALCSKSKTQLFCPEAFWSLFPDITNKPSNSLCHSVSILLLFLYPKPFTLSSCSRVFLLRKLKPRECAVYKELSCGFVTQDSFWKNWCRGRVCKKVYSRKVMTREENTNLPANKNLKGIAVSLCRRMFIFPKSMCLVFPRDFFF